MRGECSGAGLELLAEDSRRLQQRARHSGPLRALSRKDKDDLAVAVAKTGDGARSGKTLSEGVERVKQGETVVGDEGGGVEEVRAGGSQGEADIEEREVGVGGEVS